MNRTLCTSSIHPPPLKGLRRDTETTIAIHPHCHAKSIINPAFMRRLAETFCPGGKRRCSIPHAAEWQARFGALAEKYDLSVQVAQDLMDKLDKQSRGTQIIASGTSCRHQNQRSYKYPPKAYGPPEVLADALP